MVTCYPSYDMTPPLPSPAQCGAGGSTAAHKDYSRPLHVDCSVEYELPDAAKPPAGTRSEPLLMIHPCYYRRAEAQRRTRFVNNLPKSSLSSPVSSGPGGRRSKVARLTPAEPPAPVPAPASWSQPKPPYPAPPISSRYKVAATADFSTSSWPGRTAGTATAGHIAPAAPSSAKLDAGAVLSELLATTCSELNNNYMKQQQPSTQSQQQSQQPAQPQQASNQQTSSDAQVPSGPSLGPGAGSRLYSASLAAQAASAQAPAVAAAAVVSSYQMGGDYQQLPGYHPHLQQPLSATAAVDSLLSCKTCQYQPQHSHSHPHPHPQHPGQASQATQAASAQAALGNRLYGGGLIKAVEPNPEHAANPVPAKVRRCGVKRSRSSRVLTQDMTGPSVTAATPSASAWSDAMLHLNAATGFSFESPATATGVWGAYGHQGTPQHHPAHPVAASANADPLGGSLGAWGAMFPHCREREEDSRVLWNSDSLLRLVPV